MTRARGLPWYCTVSCYVLVHCTDSQCHDRTVAGVRLSLTWWLVSSCSHVPPARAKGAGDVDGDFAGPHAGWSPSGAHAAAAAGAGDTGGAPATGLPGREGDRERTRRRRRPIIASAAAARLVGGIARRRV